MLKDAGKVWDVPSGRRLCFVVGGKVSERRNGPPLYSIRDGRVHVGGPDGKVVASFHGRLLCDGVGGGVLASITDNEICDGIDGPVLATFAGGVEVGLGGAAFLLIL